MAFIRRVFGAQVLEAATYEVIDPDPGAAMRRDFHAVQRAAGRHSVRRVARR